MKILIRAAIGLSVLLLLAGPASAQAIVGNTNLGLATSPAVTGDANGTLIGHVRFLDKMFNDVWDSTLHQMRVVDSNLGNTTDAAVTGDTNGSLIAHTRYLDKFVADVWDSANHRLNMAVANGSQVDGLNLAMTAPMATSTATGAVLECAIVSTASTNSTSCKGGAGNLYGYELYNTTTTVYYLRLYNLATSPTATSATGWIRSIPIPPAAAAGQVGGALSPLGPPVNYGTGIGYVITSGSTSTDNGNAATGIFGVIKYK